MAAEPLPQTSCRETAAEGLALRQEQQSPHSDLEEDVEPHLHRSTELMWRDRGAKKLEKKDPFSFRSKQLHNISAFESEIRPCCSKAALLETRLSCCGAEGRTRSHRPSQSDRRTAMRSPWMAFLFFANISLAISPLRGGSSAALGRVQRRISRVKGLEGGSRGSWMCCARCGWRLCQNARLLRGDIYSVRPCPAHPSRANSLLCSLLCRAPFDPKVRKVLLSCGCG
jgi:hypothetical protein